MILGADTEREIVELPLVEAERIKPARITGIGKDGWRKRQQTIDEAVFVLLGALELLVFMRVPRAERKSVVEGKSVTGGVDQEGRRIITKKTRNKLHML